MLEEVRSVIRALQTFMRVLLAKIVSNVNLNVLTILPKRLLLDAWLGPVPNSTDWYIIVLKFQTKICKDGRQENLNQLLPFEI